MSEKISRKIYFYQLTSTFPDLDGTASKVDLEELFNDFDSLDDAENFMDWKEDDNLGSWLQTNTAPYKFILGRVRVKNFPRKNSGRNLEDLVLADNEGLVELTHMLFYSNGIVGVEYNHHGPRISAFRDYVWEKFQKRIYYHSLYDGDVSSILKQLKGLQEITMRVSPSMLASNTEGSQGLLEGLKNIGSGADCDMIEIKLKNYKDKSNPSAENFFNSNILSLCKKIINSPGAKFGLEKVELTGVDREGKTQIRNLFEDEFVFTTDVVKLDSSKAVNGDDMFKKLKKVFKENEDKLIDSKRISYIEDKG